MDLSVDSDSNHSSMSSSSSDAAPHRCSSFSRLSLESAASASAPDTSSSLTAKDFKLIRRIGSGDVGTVYLCRRRADDEEGRRRLYAMKVVDREAVRKKEKVERAETERKVLKLLRHPFLPTLYADFDASPNHSCLVMEYCSGGDLHSLRHHQPGFRFSLNAARFYAAEVLLSLEYLHLLGIVYRDLKPENILIRSDGHVMLSDFDLSLLSVADPTVTDAVGPTVDYDNQPSCFGRSKKKKNPGGKSRLFVAEPTAARSNSFVGTHEYVAPEVASGRPHGSSVDWWAYGVLLYELLYGSTPFVGPTNDVTLKNIIKKPLAFPPAPAPTAFVSDWAAARDLITKLLVKETAARLGSSRGASDVKVHPFFKGLNFALLRSCRPPVVPKLGRAGSTRKPDRFDFF